jgi:hypothetical protein
MTLSSSLEAESDSNGVLIKFGSAKSSYFTALTNGSDIFLTAAVTFQNETNPEDIDLAASGERVDGIVIGTAYPTAYDLSKDSDDPYDDNTWVRCYKPMPRDLLYATVATNTTISKDDWVKYSGGFLTGATSKDDAIGRLENGGVAITGASGTEFIASIEWGSD